MKENFRWALHTGGVAVLKPRDYESSKEVEAISPYAVWKLLSEGAPLQPGDVLEALDENRRCLQLEIYKYIGFEPAIWQVPEPKPELVAISDQEQ